MNRIAILGLLVASLLAAGCAGSGRMSCESSARYASSGSIPPVRVPEDLSPPDESQSLRIPPEPDRDSAASLPPGQCLESPPSYFDERA
jgi:hypothetical protein